jgi:general secretion pathway protein L
MLIIYLPTHAPTHYDHVVSTDGVSVDSYGQCEASQLPQDPGERVGVVPWHMLSWHKVTVPPSVGSRKTLVLNSLLEDNLLQEPQAVHLAVAPGATGILRRGGELLVAACDKQWLVQTLERLQRHGCTLQRLVPELHPLAAQQTPKLHLIPHEGQTQALVCTHDSVWPVPLMAAPDTGVTDKVEVFAEPALALQAEHLSGQTPSLLTAPQRWLLATQSDWDLAQNEFAQNRRMRLLRWFNQCLHSAWHAPHWRSSRRALLSLLLVQWVGLNVWAWQDESQLAQQQAELAQLFKQSLPQASLVLDPPRQMQRELQRLQQQTGQLDKQDLLPMLAALSAQWPDAVMPESLDYRPGELRLKFSPAIAADAVTGMRLSDSTYVWQVQEQEAVLKWQGSP